MPGLNITSLILPRDNSTTSNAPSTVSWQTAFWLIIALATNTMTQPCGRVLGYTKPKYRVFVRAIPMACAVDALSVICFLIALPLVMKISWQETRRTILRSRYQKRSADERVDDVQDLVYTSAPRLALFFLTGLFPAVKLAVLRGVPGTQALGFIYFASFLVMELFIMFCSREDINSIPEHPYLPVADPSRSFPSMASLLIVSPLIAFLPTASPLIASSPPAASSSPTASSSSPTASSPPTISLTTAETSKTSPTANTISILIISLFWPLLLAFFLQFLHFIWFTLHINPIVHTERLAQSHHELSKSTQLILKTAGQLYLSRISFFCMPNLRHWVMIAAISCLIFHQFSFVLALAHSLHKNSDSIDIFAICLYAAIVLSLFTFWFYNRKAVFGPLPDYFRFGIEGDTVEFQIFFSYLIALVWWYAYEYNPEGTVVPSWTYVFG